MSSYCLCVHADKLVPLFPIVLPVFSFLPPMDFTFQFSSGCLAKSLQSPGKEEKLNRIDYSSGVEECLDCDPGKAARPGNEHMDSHL